MKKYIKPTLIIIFIIIIFGNCYYLFFTPYGNINTTYYVKDFEKYKSNYETACDEIVKMSKSNGFEVANGEIYFYDIGYSTVVCAKLEPEYTYYGDRTISPNASISFKKIVESFPNDDHSHELNYIYYSQEFIGFASKSGLYSVVFSVNDKKPTDELNPYGKEEIKIRTKKIQKNWYHVWH